MASGLLAEEPSFASRNPFRRSGIDQPVLHYYLGSHAGSVAGDKYRTYQYIFRDRTQDQDFIADQSAVELIQLSKLPGHDLAELWEDALRATFPGAEKSDIRQGYLSKREFFVLLSELQAKLGLSDNDFSKIYLGTVETSRLRSNPFKKHRLAETSVPDEVLIQAPPLPPKIVDHTVSQIPAEEKIPLAVQAVDVGTGQPTADGYAEYVGAYGAPLLGSHSLDVRRPNDLPTLGERPDNSSNDTNKDFPIPVENPVTPLNRRDKDLPIPVGNAATLFGPGDKEVVVYGGDMPIWVPPHDSQKEVLDDFGDLESLKEAMNDFTEVTASPSGAGIELAQGKQGASNAKGLNAPDQDRSSDIGTMKSVLSDVSIAEDSSRTQSPADLLRPAPQQQSVISLGTYEVEAPNSTVASDELALQRLRALQPEGGRMQLRKKELKTTIGTALRRLQGKASTEYRKETKSTTMATSGFSHATFSKALQDAVMEGNVPLISSLFNLGADVNFSQPKQKVYHYILDVAVLAGNSQIIDLFMALGADGITVDHALTTAYFAGSVDLAVKLAPNANVYHLQLISDAEAEVAATDDGSRRVASSLGRVCRDSSMPAETRSKFLNCIMEQKYFDPSRVVYRIQIPSPGVENLSFNVLETLVRFSQAESLKTVLGRIDDATCSKCIKYALCELDDTQWQEKPIESFEILKLLVGRSAPVDTIKDRSHPMNPLANALAGENYEAVKVLIEHGADPESVVCLHVEGDDRCRWFSALAYAAYIGNLGICKMLVDAGATPWRTSYQDHPPLYFACEKGHSLVAMWFFAGEVLRGGPDGSVTSECLKVAVRGFEPEIVNILIQRATLLPDTWTSALAAQPKPLQRAAHLKIIDLLLSSPNYMSTDENAITAAIDSRNFAGLSKVLEKEAKIWGARADTNAVNWYNKIACGLSYAQNKGDAQDFVLLLQGYAQTQPVNVYEGTTVVVTTQPGWSGVIDPSAEFANNIPGQYYYVYE